MDYQNLNLFEDIKLLKLIQSLCIKILQDDPKLEKEKNIRLKKIIDEKLKNRIEI